MEGGDFSLCEGHLNWDSLWWTVKMNVMSFLFLIFRLTNHRPFQKTSLSSHEAPYCVPECQTQGFIAEVNFSVLPPQSMPGLSDFVQCMNPKLIFCTWIACKSMGGLKTCCVLPDLVSLRQACPGDWQGWGKAVCKAAGAEGPSGARCVLPRGPHLTRHCPVRRLHPVSPGSNDSSISWCCLLLRTDVTMCYVIHTYYSHRDMANGANTRHKHHIGKISSSVCGQGKGKWE